MQTKFIAIAVSLQAPADKLRVAAKGGDTLRSDALKGRIESRLAEHGMPLRWAVTSINHDEQVAHVEAVVTFL